MFVMLEHQGACSMLVCTCARGCGIHPCADRAARCSPEAARVLTALRNREGSLCTMFYRY
jgi:hypothetical protein